MTATVFDQIISGELPCDKVFENDRIIAFKDIHPAAPVHLLIVPKKPIPCLQAIEEEDLSLMGEVVAVAQELARAFQVEDGYRLITNNGTEAGQTVPHLHFHLLGGRILGKLG